MHNFKANYDKILDILNEIEEKSNFLQQIRLPKLTDKELTAVNLTAEYMGVDSEYQLNLVETSNIKLSVPMRKNQHNYKDQPYIFRKSRKRIEILFSQLCDQFMIRCNYAKSFNGFKTRILSKITALTVIQYINHFLFGRNINNLKIKIA